MRTNDIYSFRDSDFNEKTYGLNLSDSDSGVNIYLSICNHKINPENVKHILSSKKVFLNKSEIAITKSNKNALNYVEFLLDNGIIDDYTEDDKYYLSKLAKDYRGKSIVA